MHIFNYPKFYSMQPQIQRLIFYAVFSLAVVVIIIPDRKYYLLCDTGAASKNRHSFARTKLVWFIAIVITSFFTKNAKPIFDFSSLFFLGIIMATTGVGLVIHISDYTNPSIPRNSQGLRRIQKMCFPQDMRCTPICRTPFLWNGKIPYSKDLN